MKKIGSLFLSVLICAVMAALVVRMPVNAAEGTCGDNLTWQVVDGTLTVSGSGEMEYLQVYPWEEYDNEISAIVVEPGVTTIARSAFSDMRLVTTVSLPDTLTIIGYYAFNNCMCLGSITIPDSVTEIDGSAFGGCYSLTEITLSKNLTSLGGNMFSRCQKLHSITIPDGVTRIGGYMFTDCTSLQSVTIGAGVSSSEESSFWRWPKLAAFTVSDANPYFTTDHGVIYNKNKTELVRMPQGFQGSYSILPGTTKVRIYAAYECTGLTALSVPSSVKTIEDYAFDACSSLKSVSFANGLQTIGTDGFARCTSLASVTFPSSITKLGLSSFSGCISLTEITFTGIAPMIADNAFSRVTATVYYPGNKAGWKDTIELYGGHLKWKTTEELCAGKHIEVDVPAEEPTCTAPGRSAGKTCTRCGIMTKEQTTIPATGHSYGQWEQIKAPTETTTGVARKTCSKCNTAMEKEIPVLGSEVTEPTTTPEPTQSVPAPTEPSQEATTGQIEDIAPEHTKPDAEPSPEESVTESEPTKSPTPSESFENEQNKDSGKKKNPIILYGAIAAAVAVGSIVAIVLIKKEII